MRVSIPIQPTLEARATILTRINSELLIRQPRVRGQTVGVLYHAVE
jgi:hypothetical protein